MRATMLLCDHAEVAEGKLFINGGGWDQIAPNGGPTGVAVVVHVPWDETNRPKTVRLALIDDDGHPVIQPTPDGQGAVQFEMGFEVGRPPGLPHGNEVPVPMALNFPPLSLAPSQGYAWLLTVNGEELARASFRTRPS